MTYLSFNFTNLVTVTLMVAVGYVVLALGEAAVVKMQKNAAAA